MKGMNLFCSSSASTAVISSMDVQPSTLRPTPKSRVPCSSSHHVPINPNPSFQKHRKSSADNQNDAVRTRKSCLELHRLYNHQYRTGSSGRHLLASDAPFVDWVSQLHSHNTDDHHSPVFKPSSSSPSPNQVVVLRVSLHCKGCAEKVRKHISKMEGVTSYSIEMETKKVTIVGDVTPLGVLDSVSKVKNAQLWASSPWFT